MRPALFSDGEQNYSVRRTRAPTLVCAVSTLTVVSAVALLQSPAVTACAPLSFRRNYAFAVLGVLV